MKKTPKFLNFKNQKAAPGQEFILHTGRPAFLAEVHEFKNEAETIDFGKEFMELCEKNKAPCLGSKSRKPWNGNHYFFAVTAIYEQFEYTQKEADRLARITRRMADWYLFNVLSEIEINGFLPCPNCNGKARFSSQSGPHSQGGSADYIFVECENCGLRTANNYSDNTKQKAREVWNNRKK